MRAELDAYGNGLIEKVEILALSQVDTLDADARKKKAASLKRAAGRAPMLLSAVTGEGVEAVLTGADGRIGTPRRADRRRSADAGDARAWQHDHAVALDSSTAASPSRSARRCSSTGRRG